GLGNGETPIFPIHIFKIKEGINYNPEDKNYDLFKLACRVSAKRLFPNFSFIDAPYNLQYYKPNDYRTEIAYMGCRTRVIGNIYDPSREIVTGRGNLSFTSVNLPRLAIEANHDLDKFFTSLDAIMNLAIDQLYHRFQIQCKKKVRNFPFLMGQGIWLDSENLSPEESIAEILKHGTLSVGFIGLAETLKALIGKHHGEDEQARALGLEIITRMRKRLDEEAQKTGLNYSLLATPAEGLSGRFVRMDAEKYGIIQGVTDRSYYTNSFHVPVYYPISAFEKIQIEAPYHALTNAGHISYVELDGDPLKNLPAFEKIIRCMKESGIGYGSINHPVDRDPVCGYTGIINDVCPKCNRPEKDHNKIGFERIRRITGYLVGTLDRFNDAKRSEVEDRVKHNV
ncbi:MAG: anaerobic ribonucleoside-triphosphate reductase, partial [Oscillospiraceae bacterium]|nr:anaerobic ribonucleoside-triphosphate reductase [Oscillospiraceae bacterium]